MLEALIFCAILTVVDGDTVRCDGELLRMLGDGAPFVAGVDAPEIQHRECVAELMLGRLAKSRLQELVETPGMVIEDSGERDTTQHTRRLVTLRMPDGRTAGQILIDEGLAGVWTAEDGQVDWCAEIPPAE